MSRIKLLGFAALSWLPLFSMATITQASSYDVASDWKSTYANTAAVTSSTTASWGAGGAWSAGEMSFNWVNEPGYANGNSWQYMENYYNSNSVGHLTSGGTVEATYTYTVPWQTYQFNPGQTIVQAVGTTMTAQISYGGKTVSDTNGSDSNITLPSGVTNPNGSLSGTLTEIGAAKTNAANTSAAGFTTTAWSPTSGTFHDGHGSVQDSWSAVFYNYAATDETSSSLGSLNMASGSLHDVVNMANEFGPSYVAWTAPQGGYVSVNMAAYDLANASDGDAGFYVIASQGYSGNSYSSGVSYTSGPSTPLMASEDFAIVGSNGVGSYYGNTGLNTTVTSQFGSTGNPGGLGSYSNGGSVSWASGSFYVYTGETLYFTDDPLHDDTVSQHGNHATGFNTDNVALSAQVSFQSVPEPSSIALLGVAGVGLALAAWKRRRTAA